MVDFHRYVIHIIHIIVYSVIDGRPWGSGAALRLRRTCPALDERGFGFPRRPHQKSRREP
jgi:hypothetical protein